MAAFVTVGTTYNFAGCYNLQLTEVRLVYAWDDLRTVIIVLDAALC